MTYTHTIRTTWQQTGQAGTVSGVHTETGDSEIGGSFHLDAAATDWEFDLPFDRNFLRSVFIVADRPCVLKTNDSGSPDDQFNLIAGVPKVWGNNADQTELFTSDVTKLFLTNSDSENAATVEVHLLLSALND